jgi:hypothetical protein
MDWICGESGNRQESAIWTGPGEEKVHQQLAEQKGKETKEL